MHALADSELCDVSRTPLDVMLTLLDVIRFDSIRFDSCLSASSLFVKAQRGLARKVRQENMQSNVVVKSIHDK